MATSKVPGPGRQGAFPTTIGKELDEVLSARGAEREARLLASEHLPRIVDLMPPEELFFTLREMEDENIPQVLRYAGPEQVQFLLDLELWKKDRLRLDSVGHWLTLLRSCGRDAMARWLRRVDLSTWVLLLGSMAKIRVADEDEDPHQDTPGLAPVTLDGVYYVSAPAGMEDLIRDALDLARSSDPDLYYRIMEGIVSGGSSETEEAVFQGRQCRLAERGFPEWEEAFGIYARLSVDRMEALPIRASLPADDQGEQPAPAPRYPVTAAGTAPDFLARALRRIDDAKREAVRSDLAHLTNKVIIADALDVSQLSSFERALRKTAGYLSVGLEFLCGIDEERAAQALETHWIEHLFRVGWTQVRAVQSKARRFFGKGWPAGRMERLLFLDTPLPEVLDGLLRKHPLWYAGVEEASYREFRTLTEVEEAARAVRRAEFLGKFLLSVVDFRLRDVQDAGSRLDTDNLKGRTVFLTALLNSAIGKEFRFAALTREEARQGLCRIWDRDTPPRRVRPELAESAVEWSAELGQVPERHREDLRSFVREALAMLEEEFGHLAPDELPDPRFTRGLWIE